MPNRIIKESVWASASLAKVSLEAQGFWLRLLPLPDDHGCFDARPAVLRARLYPLCLDKVSEAQVEGWMKELETVDCIRRWMTSSDSIWGHVPKWADHQRIRALHQRKTPEPPEAILAKSFIPIDFACRQASSTGGQTTTDDGLNLNPNPSLNPLNTKSFPASPQKIAQPPSEAKQALNGWIEKARATHRRIFGKDIKPAQVCLLAYGRNGKRVDCFGEIDILIKFWETDCLGKNIEDSFTWSLACAKNPETVNRLLKAL